MFADARKYDLWFDFKVYAAKTVLEFIKSRRSEPKRMTTRHELNLPISASNLEEYDEELKKDNVMQWKRSL